LIHFYKREMGALNSVHFCSRNRDTNNNLPAQPDLNLEEPVVVESQPEATSTPKRVRVEDEPADAGQPAPQPASPSLEPIHSFIQKQLQNSVSTDSGYDQSPEDGPPLPPAKEVDLQPPSLAVNPPSLDSEPPSLEDENILDKRVEEEEESDSDEVDLNDEDEGVHEGEVKMTKEELEELEKIREEEKEEAKRRREAEQKEELRRQELRRESMVDLAALEAEVLGEDLVEPVTGLEDTPEPETEKVFPKNRDTTDLITDMLNQMVVEGGSRDLADR